MIFKGAYSFLWYSRRKMNATSVGAERLQKPLMRMKLQYLFTCSAWVIFKEAYSLMWYSRRKMKATSVGAERLQKPLMRMKSQYLFGGMFDFQRSSQLNVVL